MPPRLAALLLASLCSLAAAAAPADGYEESLVRWGLALHARQPVPAPEGRPLEEVLVASEEVLAPGDPYPLWLNVFHARTRERVIRREVLLAPGAAYRAALAEETERNLRALGLFAVVRVVAVEGRTPGAVALLVVTKDLWSLRLNQDFSGVGGLLQRLQLQATEQNLLGLGKQVALDFLLRPDAVTLGQTYVDPRLAGSELTLSESAFLVFGRDGRGLEGSGGTVSLARPLRTLASRHGFSSSVGWRVQPVRRLRAGEVDVLLAPDGSRVPFEYDARELAGRVDYLRSWGQRLKLDVTAGVGAYHRRYRLPAGSALSPGAQAFFLEGFVPLSEEAAFLGTSVRLREARFAVLQGVNTYALSEDFQVGPSLLAVLRYAPPTFAGAAHFAEGGASVRYRALLPTGLTTLSAAGALRRPLGAGGARVTNRRWAAEVSQVSPPLAGGRLVARALVDVNIDDLDRTTFLLGGSSGLRGAPPEAYAGRRLVLFNTEYRTPPLEVLTVHLGGVLFHDAGSATDGRPAFVHSVGAGLRVLFPQFNLSPFRVDVGYALSGAQPGSLFGRLSFDSGQVTSLTSSLFGTPLD